MDQLKHFGHLVKVFVEEAILGEFVVHFRTELNDALRMPV